MLILRVVCLLLSVLCHAKSAECNANDASCQDELLDKTSVSLLQLGLQMNAGQNKTNHLHYKATASSAPIRSEDHQKQQENEGVCIENYRRGLNGVRQGLGNTLQDSSFRVPKVSEKPLVIGAGIGSTATRSVSKALMMLGQKVSHCGVDFQSCDVPAVNRFLSPGLTPGWGGSAPRELTTGEKQQCRQILSSFDYTNIPDVDAIFDTPVAEVFLYLWRSFPNAKVILTTRNSSEWLASRAKHHPAKALVPMQNPCGEYINHPATSFSGKQLETLFDMHSDLVRCLVPDNQLLEVNLFEMREYQKKALFGNLANFLGMSLPSTLTKNPFSSSGKGQPMSPVRARRSKASKP